jgi:uncharacterized membrane protein
MTLLVVGLVIFLGVHLVPTQAEVRGGLAARFGEGTYKAVFSVLSLIGLVLIVLGYHKLQLMPGKNPQLWSPPVWTRHLAFVLMLPSFVLLVAAYVPSRIRTAVKHPMLAAVKIWALAHLLANGDLGSLVLFGSFLAWAVYDRISVKERAAPGPLGERRGGLGGDLVALALGTALWAFMLYYGHTLLIGVPLLA